jgi:hypothetical protein
VRVELEPADAVMANAAPPQPAQSGVPWSRIKSGLEDLLLALYRSRGSVRFGEVTAKGRSSDGAWAYELPLEVRGNDGNDGSKAQRPLVDAALNRTPPSSPAAGPAPEVEQVTAIPPAHKPRSVAPARRVQFQ